VVKASLPRILSMLARSLAKQPTLLDLALERRSSAVTFSLASPALFVDRIERAGAIVMCQVQSAAPAKEAEARHPMYDGVMPYPVLRHTRSL
jgi:nitronate monooxygenase